MAKEKNGKRTVRGVIQSGTKRGVRKQTERNVKRLLDASGGEYPIRKRKK